MYQYPGVCVGALVKNSILCLATRPIHVLEYHRCVNEFISWPITPFIGTLGVAPDREVTTSLDGQREWGGNLAPRLLASNCAIEY